MMKIQRAGFFIGSKEKTNSSFTNRKMGGFFLSSYCFGSAKPHVSKATGGRSWSSVQGSGSSSRPSPGAYKRQIAKPSALCSFFFRLPASPWSVCLALSFASLLHTLFTAPRLPSLHLHSGLVCDRCPSETSVEHAFPRAPAK